MNTATKVRLQLPLSYYTRATEHESPYHVGDLEYAIDFICPVGTPVYAAADGLVIDVKDDSDRGGPDPADEQYGNFIEIQHEDDTVTEYEHLRQHSARVVIGQRVSSGDQIAESGATGVLGGLGPHLHFMDGRYDDDVVYRTIPIPWAESVTVHGD